MRNKGRGLFLLHRSKAIAPTELEATARRVESTRKKICILLGGIEAVVIRYPEPDD